MTYETSLDTKIDVLDLIIGFLIGHEENLDLMLQQLEGSVETLLKRDCPIEQAPLLYPKGPQPNSFTLSITSPIGFEDIKSLKIELDTKHGTHARIEKG